jgi:tetratricopeptide (TPR) repeat protein
MDFRAPGNADRRMAGRIWLPIVLGLALAGCAKVDAGKDPRATSGAGRSGEKKIPEISDRPPTPKTMYAYARVLYSQGQDAACDVLLSKLIRDFPQFQASYLAQAEVRMRQRRMDDAILTLRAGLKLSPRDDVLLNNLGMCFIMKSDCGSALWYFTKAAALAPNNGRYRSNMALALGLLGREEECRSLYAMVLAPDDIEHNQSVLDYARGTFFGVPAAPPIPTPPATTNPVEEPCPEAEPAQPATETVGAAVDQAASTP